MLFRLLPIDCYMRMYTCFASAKLEKSESEPGAVFAPTENTP